MASPPIPPKPHKPACAQALTKACPDSSPPRASERPQSPRPPPPSTDDAAPAERDYDFVVHPSPDFFCPVSMDLLLEPQLTSCCGHHLSLAASTRLQKEGKACPLCNEPTWTAVLDKFHSRRVRELRVRCPHKGNGCGWVGEVNDLERHTESCPLKLVPCDMKEFGCSAVVLRKDLATHMKESELQHLTSMAVLNLRLTKQLQQEMTEALVKLVDDMKEKEPKKQILHYRIPVRPNAGHSQQWIKHKVVIFDQYSQRKGSDRWYVSDPFYSHHHGYKFMIQICFHAFAPSHNGIGMGITLQSGEYDDQLSWPVEAEIQFEMLNQAGDHHHVMRTKNFEWYKEGRGYLKNISNPFMKYDDVEKEEDGVQYLVNDYLRFRALLTVWSE